MIQLKELINKPISGEWGSDGEGIKVLRTTNFTNKGVINFKNVISRDISTEIIEQKRLLKGDIIIEKSGGSPTQPVGRVVYFDEDGDYVCNNFTSVLRPKTEKVFPKYLHHMLFANHKFGVTKMFQNKTTGIINLQLTRYLEKSNIPLPQLETQKQIAQILDDAAALRNKTEQLLKEYDALAQSIFLEMFGDPVKNEKKWITTTIEKIVKKEKGSIKRGPFGGALKKEIFVEEGYLVYEQYHALNNDFSMERYFIDEVTFSKLKGFEVKPGDVIISCSGVYLGKLALVPENSKKGIINQALLKVTIDEKIMRNDFFIFHFSHRNFRLKYFDANRGAGIPNFPPISEFKKFLFLSPPIEVQNLFAEKITLIEKQKELVKQELKESEDLFHCLLQKAFKGELINN